MGFGRLGWMDERTVRKKIKEMAAKIAKEYKPEKIILFGSWAWGEPGPDSDVDLFIIKKSRKRRIDRARELRSILFGHGFPPMDLLVYTPCEVDKRLEMGDFFVKEIFNEGRVLHAD